MYCTRYNRQDRPANAHAGQHWEAKKKAAACLVGTKTGFWPLSTCIVHMYRHVRCGYHRARTAQKYLTGGTRPPHSHLTLSSDIAHVRYYLRRTFVRLCAWSARRRGNVRICIFCQNRVSSTESPGRVHIQMDPPEIHRQTGDQSRLPPRHGGRRKLRNSTQGPIFASRRFDCQ